MPETKVGGAKSMLPETAILQAGEGRQGPGPDGETPQEKAARVMRFAYKTGTRPLDGYTIKRGVGVGGFGEVYFAVSDAGKEVALKRVQRNLDVEVRGVRQCLNLKHPNLIALYDLKYDDEGQVWVVMEYVAGESLKDVIDRNPNGMPSEELQRWFEGIAAGVCCLHDHGIVHRDLKPGNIFEDDGVIKIGDYGLLEVHFGQSPERADRERGDVSLHGSGDWPRGLRPRNRRLRPGHHAVRDADRTRSV